MHLERSCSPEIMFWSPSVLQFDHPRTGSYIYLINAHQPLSCHICRYTSSKHTYIYDSLSDVPESRVCFASKNLTPCNMLWNDFLIGQFIAECHSFFKYVWHAIGESRPFGRQNLFSPKKHLQTAIFRRKILASPHFGKIWRPNCWHQVNFWGTPEKFGV